MTAQGKTLGYKKKQIKALYATVKDKTLKELNND